MSTWKVILATLVIFVAGLFTGGTLLSKFGPPRFGFGRPPRLEGPYPWQVRDEYVRRLSRELDLTAAQTEQIAKIVTDSQVVMSNLFSQIGPEMRAEMQKVDQSIRAILTPEQERLFETMRRRRPPPGEGPPEPRRFRMGGGPPDERGPRFRGPPPRREEEVPPSLHPPVPPPPATNEPSDPTRTPPSGE